MFQVAWARKWAFGHDGGVAPKYCLFIPQRQARAFVHFDVLLSKEFGATKQYDQDTLLCQLFVSWSEHIQNCA